MIICKEIMPGWWSEGRP